MSLKQPTVNDNSATFAGTGVPAQILLDYLEAGQNLNDFLSDYPAVQREQVLVLLESFKQILHVVSVDANLSSPFKAENRAWGVITGIVRDVSSEPELKITLQDSLFQTFISVYLDDSFHEQATDTLNKTVRATGLIYRDGDNGRPLQVAEVKSLEVVKPSSSQSYQQARGAIRWQEGDEPAEVSIRRIRDAS